MAIPAVTKDQIKKALEYIDANGIPFSHQSTRYFLVEDGKEYPPKYVLAVAAHLATGEPITTDSFNSVEARKYLKKSGFTIDEKFVKYEMTITASGISSTDPQFDPDNLHLGDNYKPLAVYMTRADGTTITRNRAKGEYTICNQTLPKLAMQIFESDLVSLPAHELQNFPVCQYTPSETPICGIYSSEAEYRKYRNSIEQLHYECADGRKLVIYAWNVFSTLTFVQECLKRFGASGDVFTMTYREKAEKEIEEEEHIKKAVEADDSAKACNSYSKILRESKNVIFRGAPGTGKSYLARQIAADMISDGLFDKDTLLSDAQKKQMAFVQFHPSYDYSDFVEGLRPVEKNGTLGFELRDGVFKEFVDRARKNFENAHKSATEIEKELISEKKISNFLNKCQDSAEELETVSGNKFIITYNDEHRVDIYIPNNEVTKTLSIKTDEIRRLVLSGQKFASVKDVRNFFGKGHNTQQHSYEHIICKKILETEDDTVKVLPRQEPLKNYVFIIDEINRGEISKILGELFFAIDPGYRGEDGGVLTQYANLHDDPEEKFYIPENVYIIGTMNDIDRSVDTFDFAMRRRFRFIEIKPEDTLEMLDKLPDKDEAIRRMSALNKKIVNHLNANYQIGAAYFLKLQHLTFDALWEDYLQPLLQEYIIGMTDEEGVMREFAQAYGYGKATVGEAYEG